MGRLVTRFGAAAVFGPRRLTVREMRDIMLAETVERAYAAEKRAERSEEGSAAWARNNPVLAGLLARSVKAHHAIQD